MYIPSSSGEATDKDECDEMEVESSVEVYLHPQQYTEQHHKLPFSGVSAKWYERQNELAVKNVAREKRRDESIVQTDEKGNLLCQQEFISENTTR